MILQSFQVVTSPSYSFTLLNYLQSTIKSGRLFIFMAAAVNLFQQPWRALLQ